MRKLAINERALVLLSGGQDSTTCLMWAINHCGRENVSTISFNYGQKHAQELQSALEIANHFRVPFVLKDCRGLTASSALTDHAADINAAHGRNTSLPASFTAGRNALFLTIAAAYAYEHNIPNLVTGVCETDYSGYPDCRDAFIRSQAATLSLALDCKMNIFTPLMHLSKAETWKLAKQLSPEVSRRVLEPNVASFHRAGFDAAPNPDWAFEIVRTKTLTDYNGNTTMNEWGMGVEDNPSSKLRAAGYREAKAHGWV